LPGGGKGPSTQRNLPGGKSSGVLKPQGVFPWRCPFSLGGTNSKICHKACAYLERGPCQTREASLRRRASLTRATPWKGRESSRRQRRDPPGGPSSPADLVLGCSINGWRREKPSALKEGHFRQLKSAGRRSGRPRRLGNSLPKGEVGPGSSTASEEIVERGELSQQRRVSQDSRFRLRSMGEQGVS